MNVSYGFNSTNGNVIYRSLAVGTSGGVGWNDSAWMNSAYYDSGNRFVGRYNVGQYQSASMSGGVTLWWGGTCTIPTISAGAYLDREILDTDVALAEILRDCAPLLRDVPGVGFEVASQLLITLREAAGHFNTWPGTISRVERGLSRNDNLAAQFRDWLHEQKESQNIS